MRFLADENLPRAVIAALEADGHDVLWIRTASPGSLDHDVLALAQREQRILLTFDKDFGEVAARSNVSAACGVVLLRVAVPKTPDEARRIADLLVARSDWGGHFSVIEPGRVRMRPLPVRPRSLHPP